MLNHDRRGQTEVLSEEYVKEEQQCIEGVLKVKLFFSSWMDRVKENRTF